MPVNYAPALYLQGKFHILGFHMYMEVYPLSNTMTIRYDACYIFILYDVYEILLI